MKSISNHIKYETLYRELGKDDSTRKVKFTVREDTKKILDSWKGSIFGDIEFTDYAETFLGKCPTKLSLNTQSLNNRIKSHS